MSNKKENETLYKNGELSQSLTANPTYQQPAVKPTYQQSKAYSPAVMQQAYNKAYNRTPFTYNADTDSLYQNWRNRYMADGKKAMEDTVGNAALLTGGYGNSYGVTAGQQVYNDYAANAADKADEFRNNAYQNWLTEGQQAQQAYAALRDAEQTDYDRYTDSLNNYYKNLNFDRSVYESDRDYNRSIYESDRNFNEEQRQYNDKSALNWAKFSETQKQNDFDNEMSSLSLAQEITSASGGALSSNDTFDMDDVAKFIKNYKNDLGSPETFVTALFSKFGAADNSDDLYDMLSRMPVEDEYGETMKGDDGQPLTYFDVLTSLYPQLEESDEWSSYGEVGAEGANYALAYDKYKEEKKSAQSKINGETDARAWNAKYGNFDKWLEEYYKK